jgi:hypothetical protein
MDVAPRFVTSICFDERILKSVFFARVLLLRNFQLTEVSPWLLSISYNHDIRI